MKISYFASVREAVGVPEEILDRPNSVETVAQLIDWLEQSDTRYQRAFADRDALNIAINETLATLDSAINEHDNLALFPPMTGG